jgi:hypothetical protein
LHLVYAQRQLRLVFAVRNPDHGGLAVNALPNKGVVHGQLNFDHYHLAYAWQVGLGRGRIPPH